MSSIIRHDPNKKLSDAVEYNGLIYLAGQVGEDASASMKAQTESVLRQIDALLKKCGPTSRAFSPRRSTSPT